MSTTETDIFQRRCDDVRDDDDDGDCDGEDDDVDVDGVATLVVQQCDRSGVWILDWYISDWLGFVVVVAAAVAASGSGVPELFLFLFSGGMMMCVVGGSC